MPLERAVLIGMLDPDKFYGPAEVAASGYERGGKDYELARKAFWYFARLNEIHLNYDNSRDAGEPPEWYGSSWQDALGWRMHEVADLMDKLEALMSANPDGVFYLSDLEIVAVSPAVTEDEFKNQNNGTMGVATELIPLSIVHHEEPTFSAKRRVNTKRLVAWAVLVSIPCFMLYFSHQYSKGMRPSNQDAKANLGAPIFLGASGEAP